MGSLLWLIVASYLDDVATPRHRGRGVAAPITKLNILAGKAKAGLRTELAQSGDCNTTRRESMGVTCSGTGPRGPAPGER